MLDDGIELFCDLLVMVVGICLNIDLVKQVGLVIGCGIYVDDQMLIFDENVFVVGECVEYDGVVFGFVVLLYD